MRIWKKKEPNKRKNNNYNILQSYTPGGTPPVGNK